MKSKNIILRSVQGLSIIAILMLLSSGFVMPLSIVQVFIVQPLLFLLLVGIISYVSFKAESKKSLGHVHQLPFTKETIQLPCCKAA